MSDHACVESPVSSGGGVGSPIVGSDARSRRRIRSAAVGAAISSVAGAGSTVVESSFSRTILGSEAGCEDRASVGGAEADGPGAAGTGGTGGDVGAAALAARRRVR